MPAKTASMMVRVFDGTRRPIPSGVSLLVTLTDGNQRTVSSDYHPGPDIYFHGLPVARNFADNYTVLVSADGYVQAGFAPVKISARVMQTVFLMLLPNDGHFNFSAARHGGLEAVHPRLPALVAPGLDNLIEHRADAAAALLNLASAMAAVYLPEGTPLDYLAELIWDRMLPDRFFAWTREPLAAQVKLAASQRLLAPVSAALHPGATSSYKQIQFGEGNLQLTFHENDRRTIDGAECFMIEVDIDYYRDPAAHLILEVILHGLTGTVTDPKTVYVLRWIAGKHAGVPEFSPPYTVEA